MSDSKPTPAPQSDATIGRLVADITGDLSDLVRSEIQLAKSELKVSVNAGSMTIALAALAAFFGLLLIIMLSITLAFFITMTGLHPAWAFLIVSGLYVVLIAVLLFVAWRKSRNVRAPKKTMETLNEIPAAFSSNSSSGPASQLSTNSAVVRGSGAADAVRDRSAVVESAAR